MDSFFEEYGAVIIEFIFMSMLSGILYWVLEMIWGMTI